MKLDDSEFRQHIDDLKAAMAGSSIAADFGLQPHGNRYFCPVCQPHGGKTPDLSIMDHGFRCFKCGISGDVIDLIVLAGSMSKAEAIRWIENRTGRSKAYPTSHQATIGRQKRSMDVKQAYPKKLPSTPASSAQLYEAFLQNICGPIHGTAGEAYLSGRGIDAAIAEKCGVRFCADLSSIWNLADRDAIKAAGLASFYIFGKAGLPVLAFPYLHAGRPVFLKVRNLLSKDEADRANIPRFLNTGGAVPCLWNHDAIQDADQILICEGEIDALSAIMAGHPAVGLPGWTHWKDAWIESFSGKDVVLVMDADSAGDKGARSIAKSFIRAGRPTPRQIILPAGMDLNDYLANALTD